MVDGSDRLASAPDLPPHRPRQKATTATPPMARASMIGFTSLPLGWNFCTTFHIGLPPSASEIHRIPGGGLIAFYSAGNKVRVVCCLSLPERGQFWKGAIMLAEQISHPTQIT